MNNKITEISVTHLTSTPHRRIWFGRGRMWKSYAYTNARWQRLLDVLGDRYTSFGEYGAYHAVWRVNA